MFTMRTLISVCTAAALAAFAGAAAAPTSAANQPRPAKQIACASDGLHASRLAPSVHGLRLVAPATIKQGEKWTVSYTVSLQPRAAVQQWRTWLGVTAVGTDAAVLDNREADHGERALSGNVQLVLTGQRLTVLWSLGARTYTVPASGLRISLYADSLGVTAPASQSFHLCSAVQVSR